MVLLRILDLRELLLYDAELLEVLRIVSMIFLAILTFDELAEVLMSFLIPAVK